MLFLRQILSYCLILVVLLYTTPLQQFLKIPLLLDHFHEHRQKKPTITFLEFIVMHYIGDDGDTSDDNKDMQLPFKKFDKASFEVYSFVAAIVYHQAGHKFAATIFSPFIRQFSPDPHEGGLFKPPPCP